MARVRSPKNRSNDEVIDQINRAIGERVLSARKAHEPAPLRQHELAKLLGYNESTYSRLETGASYWPAWAIVLIAQALNVPPGDLLDVSTPADAAMHDASAMPVLNALMKKDPVTAKALIDELSSALDKKI